MSWFESTGDPRRPWREHVVADGVECVWHSLALADMDGGGDLDIVTAMMHQGRPPQEVCIYHNLGGGASWRKQVVSTGGSHNIVVADVSGNGRPDIYGCNLEHQGPRPRRRGALAQPGLRQRHRDRFDPANVNAMQKGGLPVRDAALDRSCSVLCCRLAVAFDHVDRQLVDELDQVVEAEVDVHHGHHLGRRRS